MSNYFPSIQERFDSLIKEMEGCASCGMSAGDSGFSSDSAPEGPTAGYDPVITKVKRRKKKREGVNEGRKSLPDFKEIMQEMKSTNY